MSKAKEVYTTLFDHFGTQNWWPGDSPFEVIVGAILTQQTKWENVEKAIANLKESGMLDPAVLACCEISDLEYLVKPTGFYRQKAGYLKGFCQHLVDVYDGDLGEMFAQSLGELRSELLSLRGIGPETADSIILYAAGKPSFVVDSYTIRVGNRMGLSDSRNYDEVRDYFQSEMEPDVPVYNEYHALFVILGKTICTVKHPRCRFCPINDMCDTGKSVLEHDH